MTTYNKLVGQRIKDARLKADLTLEELGNRVGLSKSTVTKYERGEIKTLDVSKLKDFAFVLGIDSSYLAGWEDDTNKTKEFIPKHKQVIKIPVLGTVAAGIPIEAITDVIGYEEITETMASHGEHYGLKIKGDSMYPKIENGDTIIFRVQPDIENGQIAIVSVNGQDATCKKVTKTKDGIMLVGFNQREYEPTFYSNEEIEELPITIIGLVVEIRRSLI